MNFFLLYETIDGFNFRNNFANLGSFAKVSISFQLIIPWYYCRIASKFLFIVQTFCLFVGSADRIIKIFDLATGTLKLSLTGHISAVRGVIVSPRMPFLFSCGEDKQVKCWDLEYNKVGVM